MKRWVIFVASLLFVLVCACTNPKTPAGYEGYLYRKPYIGTQKFKRTQKGPASPGLRWRWKVINIDVRWQTCNEKFKVISKDNLELNFNAHIVIRPKPGSVKDIVETYGGEDWYERTVRQPFRNSILDAVAGYKALEAKDKRDEIAFKAFEKFRSWIQDKPFEISSLVVGTIELPPRVKEAQDLKIAKETELERKKFEVEIEKKDAEIRVIEARGIAQAQRIINASLTPLYIQHEAIQAQKAMADSPNNTMIYIPVGAQGVPLVYTLGK